MRTTFLILAALTLAGCNTEATTSSPPTETNTTTDTTTTDPTTPTTPEPTAQSVLAGMTPVSFATVQDGLDAATSLTTQIDDAILASGISQKLDLPTTGVVGYEGFLRISELNNETNSASGQLLLAVDFGAAAGNVVAGLGFNFYDAAFDPIEGQIMINNGFFTPITVQLVDGTILDGEGVQASYAGELESAANVTATLNGTVVFGFANGNELINGSLYGTASGEGFWYDTTGGLIAQKKQ